MIALSCFGFLWEFSFSMLWQRCFRLEKHDLSDDITLISSGRFREHLILILRRSFPKRSFWWLLIFCCKLFSLIPLGPLLTYRPKSVSRLCFVPSLAISELRTLTSGLLGSCMILVVGVTFPTVLPGAKTYKSSPNSSFWWCAACIFLHLQAAFVSWYWSRKTLRPHQPSLLVLHLLLLFMSTGICGAD